MGMQNSTLSEMILSFKVKVALEAVTERHGGIVLIPASSRATFAFKE